MRVLITGGSRGIGKSIVDIFLSRGHYVYSPNRKELDLSLPVNLKDRNFDIVVNCAGINPIKPLEKINSSEVMRVNYYSPLEIIQQCLPYMVKKKYGRIINFGSVWIDIAKKGRLDYSASKSALHSLTKSITSEYGKYNIIANTISPGFIKTDLTFQNNTPEEIDLIVEKVPLNRLGTPEEISKMVYYLTVENDFLSGQNIIIDGGFSCSTK